MADLEQLAVGLYDMGAVRVSRVDDGRALDLVLLRSGAQSPVYVTPTHLASFRREGSAPNPVIIRDLAVAAVRELMGQHDHDHLVGLPPASPLLGMVADRMGSSVLTARGGVAGEAVSVRGEFRPGDVTLPYRDTLVAADTTSRQIAALRGDGLVVPALFGLVDYDAAGHCGDRTQLDASEQRMPFTVHAVLGIGTLVEALEVNERISPEQAALARQYHPIG